MEHEWVPYGYVMGADGTVRPATGWEEALEWERDPERTRIGLTEFDGGKVVVSTVFLRIPGFQYFKDQGKRLHFETMIFRGEEPDRRYQYATREEAVAGHDRACAIVRRELEEGGGTPR